MEPFTEKPCTVETLITQGIFRENAILAGLAGLNRPLSMVSVIEVPDIADWVHPGELLITTAFAFKDNVHLLETLVESLADQGLAGLAIKPRRFLSDLPTAVLQHADNKSFPIIEIDPHVTYGDLLKQISELILSRNVAVKTKFLDSVYKELTKALVDRNGLEGLGSRLAKILGRSVMIESPGIGRRYFGAVHNDTEGAQSRFSEVIWHRATPVSDHIVAYGLVSGGTVLQARVGDGLRNKGSIYVEDSDPTHSDVVIKAVEYAASLAAVEMMRIETVQQVNQHYRTTFLAEWLEGRIIDRRRIIDRGHQYGWSLEQDHTLVLMRMPSFEGPQVDAPKNLPEVICCPKDRDWVILIPESAGDGIDTILRTAEIAEGAGILTRSIGPVPSENMAATYAELLEMLEVAETIGIKGLVTRDSLGIYALWPLIPDKQKLHDFLWKNLSAVILYDQSHHTQLMGTLEAFLDARGNVAATAKRLFVHYNTVLYRLKKVEELTPMRFIDSEEGQLLLHVAVKLWAISNRPPN